MTVVFAVESDSLSESHPLGAVLLGVGLLLAAYAWLRFILRYERFIARTVSANPTFLNSRLYRVLHVYGGALFLAVGGMASIVAGAIHLG